MGRSTRVGSATKPGAGPPSQLLLIELKHRILGALHKLADRDTQQIAVDDLERIVLTLSPEGISLCLNCLYDTDAQQKSVVRRECVRLLGTLASVHGDLLIPHLSRIVTTIVRRLKDTDSNVRDACVETMGVLASEVPGAGGEGGPLAVYVKPLFDAMNEQNRSLQMGAGLCLARVIECLKDPQPILLQKMCPRIVKFSNSPSFQAKPALLSAIGSLFQAAGAGAAQFLPALIPLAQEALESSDWTTRKAAADTLSRLASTLGPALFTFKKDSVEALESSRFDKVKPVRDSVGDALQLWRAIAESDGSNCTPNSNARGVPESPRQPMTPSSAEVGNSRTGDKTIVHSRSASNVAGIEVGGRSSSGGTQSRPSSNSPPSGSGSKRKAPALSDKKINPDFFRKLEIKGPDDWPVEIARSTGGPPAAESPGKCSEEAEEVKVDVIRSGDFGRNGSGNELARNFPSEAHENGGKKPSRSGSGETRESLVWRRGEFTTMHQRGGSKPGIGSYDGKGLGGNVNVINNPIPEMLEANSWMKSKERDADSWESSGQALSPSSSATYEDDGPAINSMDEWTSVQKQLQLLEFQQRNHLKMFQEFMADVHQSMLEMDLRVRGLERVISAARDVPASVNRIMNGGPSGFDAPPVRSLSKFLASSQSLSEKLRKAANASRAAFSERQPRFGLGTDIRSGRSSPWKNDSDADYDSPYSSAQRTGSTGSNIGTNAFVSQRVEISSPPTLASYEGGGEKASARHGWEKSAGPAPFGDNHIVRNVWQASKDEATLEAIRGAPVAKDDSRTGGVGAKKSSTNAVRLSSENILEGKETFWMLWSRAMDYIRVGDIDAAYGDVLASGDEMLLIRLMSHTGPVLNKLASGTALEMLHTAIQLLQQQSFLDSVLPWVHQVADLIATKGPEFLGLSADGKRDLVSCLQESAAMEFPEGWMASSVADVAQQLCTAWTIDL